MPEPDAYALTPANPAMPWFLLTVWWFLFVPDALRLLFRFSDWRARETAARLWALLMGLALLLALLFGGK